LLLQTQNWIAIDQVFPFSASLMLKATSKQASKHASKQASWHHDNNSADSAIKKKQ